MTLVCQYNVYRTEDREGTVGLSFHFWLIGMLIFNANITLRVNFTKQTTAYIQFNYHALNLK